MALNKIWKNRPFGPLPGETPAEYEARLDAWAAANPGDYTPLDKAGMEDVETRAQAELNTKAPLASPALSGTPTAPTAAAATNTTQVATTAFVLANSGTINGGTP